MEETKLKKLKIDASKLESIIKELGMATVEQAGFNRVEGPKGRRIYVAKTQMVGRVDISGFEMPLPCPGIKDLKGESFGSVKQQLDFSGATDEETILSAFRAVCLHMQTLGPAEAKKKEFKPKAQANLAQAADSSGVPAVFGNPSFLLPISKLNPEQKLARRKLIEETAARMVAEVSSKALEALA